MKENADNYLDDLAKKVIKETAVERPSFNFTDIVMSEVNLLSKSHATIYQPLITKKTGLLIFVGFLSVILYIVLFGTQTESSGWFSNIDFSVLSNTKLSYSIPSFNISKIGMYAVVLFGIMFCIQISYLKHQFNKQFEV